MADALPASTPVAPEAPEAPPAPSPPAEPLPVVPVVPLEPREPTEPAGPAPGDGDGTETGAAGDWEGGDWEGGEREGGDAGTEPATPTAGPVDFLAEAEEEPSVTLRVWRGDASGGELVDYTLPAQEGEVVLDVIHRVQASVAPDLACRWNCKAGKCGSCSSEINGRPRLMCMTRVDELPEGPITVTPLRTFPIVRDLVTDVSFNFEMATRVPAFAPGPRPPEGYRMQQVDVERGQEFRKCIECFMCQDVCHVIRDHEDNKAHFAGPRFFIRFAELEMHPLDTNDRRELLRQRMGIGFCNITKCCTEVCPEHIKITDNAIIPLKERVIDASYDPVVWIGRKILRRRRRTPDEAIEWSLDASDQSFSSDRTRSSEEIPASEERTASEEGPASEERPSGGA